MHRTLQAALVAAVLVAASQPAAAQGTPWEDRVFGSISFGVEASSAEVVDEGQFPVYGETASLRSSTDFGSDGIIDLSGGVRVWRNMGVAIGFHAKSSTGEANIQGSIPHPIFFDRPRTFSATQDGIDRDENAVHLQIGWMVPISEKLDVFLFAGPSFYHLKQEVATDVVVAEEGPPFSNVVVQTDFQTRKDSATGYNVGADVTYVLYTTDQVRFGVGGFLRVTGATGKIDIGDRRVETDLGGFQLGIGARVRF